MWLFFQPCFFFGDLIHPVQKSFSSLYRSGHWQRCVELTNKWFVHTSNFWFLYYIFKLSNYSAFYGVVFIDVKEAAFSNYRLWQSLGFAIAFAYSSFLCVNVKIYICLAVVLCGMAGYLAIELMEHTRLKQIADGETTQKK